MSYALIQNLALVKTYSEGCSRPVICFNNKILPSKAHGPSLNTYSLSALSKNWNINRFQSTSLIITPLAGLHIFFMTDFIAPTLKEFLVWSFPSKHSATCSIRSLGVSSSQVTTVSSSSVRVSFFHASCKSFAIVVYPTLLDKKVRKYEPNSHQSLRDQA